MKNRGLHYSVQPNGYGADRNRRWQDLVGPQTDSVALTEARPSILRVGLIVGQPPDICKFSAAPTRRSIITMNGLCHPAESPIMKNAGRQE